MKRKNLKSYFSTLSLLGIRLPTNHLFQTPQKVGFFSTGYDSLFLLFLSFVVSPPGRKGGGGGGGGGGAWPILCTTS
jgi:hypothetical protein